MDIRLRPAVHHATNKDALIEAGFAGLARDATNFLNPGYFAHKPNVPVYDYNPEKRIAEAGLSQGFGCRDALLSRRSVESKRPHHPKSSCEKSASI